MMIKKAVLFSLILLIPVFFCVDNVKADDKTSGGISYMENGWELIFDNASDDILSKHATTFYNVKDKTIDIVKKSTWEKYKADKSIDDSKIPVRYYQKVFDGPDEYHLIPVSDETLDLKDKSSVKYKVRQFKDNSGYVCKIGYGTVTYDGVNDIITVTGAGVATFNDIYNADVAGGWHQVFQLNATTYHFNCSVYVGSSTTAGNLSINFTHITCIKAFPADSSYVVRVQSTRSRCYMNHGSFCVTESVRNYVRPFSTYTYGKLYVNNSFIYTGRNRCLLYLYPYSITWINFSMLYNCGVYYNNIGTNIHVYNCTFFDCMYGIYNFYSLDLRNCSFYKVERVVQSPTNATYYNVNIFRTYASSYDIIFGANTKWCNVYNINTDRTNNALQISKSAFTNLRVNRYCSFNLTTTPLATVKLYYANGSLAFSTTASATGIVSKRYVAVSHWNDTLGTGTNCYYYTPFRLVINKTGYQTYNATFNNSFRKMDYQILLMSASGGDILVVNDGTYVLGVGFVLGSFCFVIVALFMVRRQRKKK